MTLCVYVCLEIVVVINLLNIYIYIYGRCTCADLLCPQFRGTPVTRWAGAWVLVDSAILEIHMRQLLQNLQCGHDGRTVVAKKFRAGDVQHREGCGVTEPTCADDDRAYLGDDTGCPKLVLSEALWGRLFPGSSIGGGPRQHVCMEALFPEF